MGYTHYFELENPDLEGFKEAIPTLKKIIEKHKDIICFEMDQELRPVELTDHSIRFNGRGSGAHETFIINADTAFSFDFCKTARKEYDLPVCEVLLVLNKFMPGFKISSDGLCGHLANSQAILNDPEASNADVLDCNWPKAIENVKEYGINYDVIISKERDPYCDFELVLKE